MKEYIIYYENTWMRFFQSPRHGLCVSKMENMRFSRFEILLPDSKNDFCAALSGGIIHLVCQGENGSILYLTYDGSLWEKTELLMSKENKPYTKYFNLIPMGRFMNLFYVINHDQKSMLIHQILDSTYRQPEVVDYIEPSGIRFFAAPDISSDINLFYCNSDGILGSKLYRWSHKSFMQFMPFNHDTDLLAPFACIEADRTLFCAPKRGNSGLMFYFKNESGDYAKTLLTDRCLADADPIIFKDKEKIVIQWKDMGAVMSCVSYDGGMTFSKPIKYLKNAMQDAKLFKIDNGSSTACCYGYSSENTVAFYTEPNILSIMQNTKKAEKRFVKKGQEAEEFARSLGLKKSDGWDEDPYVTKKELTEELERLSKVMEGYRKILDELNEKITHYGEQ